VLRVDAGLEISKEEVTETGLADGVALAPREEEIELAVAEDPAELQPNCIWLNSHVAEVSDQVLHTNALIAFWLAFPNELKGTVTVCVEPLSALTLNQLLEYVDAVHEEPVWISSISDPPAGPFIVNWTEV
jgi:hypothetical protein